MIKVKSCNICKEEKELSEFYKNSRWQYLSSCKSCNLNKKKRFNVLCFSCGKQFKSIKENGYCSLECRSHSQSVRMKFEYSSGIRKVTGEKVS